MSGDRARICDDPRRDYSRVEAKQGRVQLDADAVDTVICKCRLVWLKILLGLLVGVAAGYTARSVQNLMLERASGGQSPR